MEEFKLTYTDEMKKQDELWKTEEENIAIMEQLQRQVVYEAKAKGWKGSAVFWKGGNESIVDIAENEEEHQHGNEVESFGYCKALINKIEADMGTHVRKEDKNDHKVENAEEVKLLNETNNKARRVRAWDKAYNYMDDDFFVSSYGQAYDRPNMPGDTPHIEIEQTKELILMEYVGKDVLGKDIYTNDIVAYYDEKEGIIKFAIVHYVDEKFGYAPMCFGHIKDLKTIGSIYENEELIDMID